MAASFGFLPALRRPLLRAGVPMRLRLLGRLNSPFSRDPGAALALRPRSPGGLKWKIDRRRLTVARPSLPDLVLPLEGNRIADIRDQLAAAGVEIAYHAEDPAILGLGALALLPGEGDQDASNGDHIHAFTAPLWGLKGAKGRWLEEARDDLPLALREMVVKWSTGQWSDLWASYFDLLRRPGETDAHLNMRTAYEWRRPRSNRFAIAKNIKVLHGRDVWVREPWREMWTLSEPGNELSGDHHLPNATEFCYHWAQLRSLEYEDWEPLQAEAEADRPAGTLLLAPVGGLRPRHLVYDRAWSLSGGVHEVGSWPIRDYDGHILDYNCSLSDTYVLLNPSMSIFDSQIFGVENTQDPGSFFPVSTFCKGEIVLSEAPPIGDLQAHLAGGRLVREDGAPMALSGEDGLSDHEWAFGWDPIDEWFEDARSLGGWAQPSYPVQRLGGVVEHHGHGIDGTGGRSASYGDSSSMWIDLPRAYDRGWRGRWDSRKWTASGYPDPLLSGTVTTQILTDSIDSQGFAQASGTLSLRAAARFASQAAGAASGGSATLSTGIKLAGLASGQASLQQAILTTSTDMLLVGKGQASLVAATLSTGIKLASQALLSGSDYVDPDYVDDGYVEDTQGTGARLVAAPLSTAIPLTHFPETGLANEGQPANDDGPANAMPQGAKGTLRLGLGIEFESSAAGQASRVAANLSAAARFAVSGQGAQASGGGALDTGIRFASLAAGQASRAGAQLGTGIRLASQGFGAASLAAATLEQGFWPTAYGSVSRTWLFDPADASKTTLDVSGNMQEMREVGGSATRVFSQATSTARPATAIVRGRRVLEFGTTSTGKFLSGTQQLCDDMENLSGAYTLSLVWIAGASMPVAECALVSSTAATATASWHEVALNPPAGGVPSKARIHYIMVTSANQDLTRFGDDAPRAANGRYLITVTNNGAGTTRMFWDGTEVATYVSNTAVPAGVAAVLTRHYIGARGTNTGTPTTGRIGAYMRFNGALTQAQIADLAAKAAAYYP